MAHEVETMAYANTVPWHGLGNKIDAESSIETMLEASGLDWTVDLRPVFAQAKNGEMVKLPIKRALMRSTDNKVLTLTGDFWNPLQNKEALEFFREYTESGGASLETAGSLRGGKVIWALANIKKGFKVKGRDDEIKGHILMASRHEVGTTIKVQTTATRVVCANTLAMAEKDACQYSQNHLTKFDTARAKEAIGLARDQIAQLEIDINKLAAKPISTFDTLKILASSVQPVPGGVKEDAYINMLLDGSVKQSRELAGILNSAAIGPGANPDTAWGVLNGVTHYFDHVAGHDRSARLHNAWFGDRAKTKIDVMVKLLDYAS